ncbi:MAG: nicotinate phosphoribosyltransferase, partial [Crenarchaeota archaeon]|nr:nicotinate phosphoribosyltransferase [Thermoproteota archaeon]
NRSYFLFAGLEQVLIYLEKIKFTQQHLEYLRKEGFKDDFLEYLRNFKFTGDVYAVPEGSIVFPFEPLIRITAPIIEAQLVETFLLNTINLQTMVATKASRVVYAAQDKSVIEFGLRREHGIDAGMKIARSSYIAGCNGTSNVLSGMVYGIPIFGTMAHSFVMSYEKEIGAFRDFVKTFPAKSTLLIDTYSDILGAEKATIVAKELKEKGQKLTGVRIDSGDLLQSSKKIRKLLDEKKLKDVTIFASGDLDEYKIDQLLNEKAPIDGFSVGTKMGTCADYPFIDVIYKLSEVSNKQKIFSPIMKLSEGKNTLPGRKQFFRIFDNKGYCVKDIIGLSDEQNEGNPMLSKVMENGKIITNLPSLNELKTIAKQNLSTLPEKYKKIINPAQYPVTLSEELRNLVEKIKRKIVDDQILDQKSA